jgi:hypothetical protein
MKERTPYAKDDEICVMKLAASDMIFSLMAIRTASTVIPMVSLNFVINSTGRSHQRKEEKPLSSQ